MYFWTDGLYYLNILYYNIILYYYIIYIIYYLNILKYTLFSQRYLEVIFSHFFSTMAALVLLKSTELNSRNDVF